MEDGMVSTILHQCLVILSAAKDLFKLSEMTDKTVIHPERTVIPNRLSSGTHRHPELVSGSFRDGSMVHRRVILIRTFPKGLTGVKEMLNTQISICNVQWVSDWIIRISVNDLMNRKDRKEEIPFAFLFASLAPFAVQLRQ